MYSKLEYIYIIYFILVSFTYTINNIEMIVGTESHVTKEQLGFCVELRRKSFAHVQKSRQREPGNCSSSAHTCTEILG